MRKEAKVSERLDGSSRTYFFDLREARNGANYLTVKQSYKDKEGEFQRDCIFVFEDDVVKFGEVLQKMVAQYELDTQSA
ncbi:MAG: DUF3276 family protein [Bacteroidota bacterium]